MSQKYIGMQGDYIGISTCTEHASADPCSLHMYLDSTTPPTTVNECEHKETCKVTKTDRTLLHETADQMKLPVMTSRDPQRRSCSPENHERCPDARALRDVSGSVCFQDTLSRRRLSRSRGARPETLERRRGRSWVGTVTRRYVPLQEALSLTSWRLAACIEHR